MHVVRHTLCCLGTCYSEHLLKAGDHSSLFQLTSGLSPATGEQAGKWVTVCHLCLPHICFTSTVYPQEEARRPTKEPRRRRHKRPHRRVPRGGQRAVVSATRRALLDNRRASPQEGDCQQSRFRGEGTSGGGEEGLCFKQSSVFQDGRKENRRINLRVLRRQFTPATTETMCWIKGDSGLVC